jgi:hypothetical protein
VYLLWRRHTWACPARVLVPTILSALINDVTANSGMLRCAVTLLGDFVSVVVVFGNSRDVQPTRLRPHSDVLYRPKKTLYRGWRNPQDTLISFLNSSALPSTRNQDFGFRAVAYCCLNTDLKDSGSRLIAQIRLSCIIPRNIQTYLEPRLWFQRCTRTF